MQAVFPCCQSVFTVNRLRWVLRASKGGGACHVRSLRQIDVQGFNCKKEQALFASVGRLRAVEPVTADADTSLTCTVLQSEI